MSAVELVALPSRNGGRPLTVHLSWGIAESDMESIQALHAISFPVEYPDDYYNWLRSGSSVAIVAHVSHRDVVMDPHDTHSGVETELSTEAGVVEPPLVYSCLAGFCIGQLGHKRYEDGQLEPSPTGYLMSFAVDPRLRRRGVGELLLTRFLTYMFFNIPVPPLIRAGNGGLSFGKALAPVLKSFFTAVSSFLQQRLGIESHSEQLNNPPRDPKTLPDRPIDSGHSNLRCGVAEVWLHCLASDEALLRFYSSRGFMRVRVIRGFYMFDARLHDGMLLVIRRGDFSSLGNAVLQHGVCRYKQASTGSVGLRTDLTDGGEIVGLDEDLARVADIELFRS
ncbi:acetyltransferase, putative [Trypanosoma equiperdum]|nr:acetyltransferase, putative [Trypanosoma equiperdum]